MKYSIKKLLRKIKKEKLLVQCHIHVSGWIINILPKKCLLLIHCSLFVDSRSQPENGGRCHFLPIHTPMNIMRIFVHLF